MFRNAIALASVLSLSAVARGEVPQQINHQGVVSVNGEPFVALSVSRVLAGSVLYVDGDASGPTHDGSTWCNAFTELQDALAVAAAN